MREARVKTALDVPIAVIYRAFLWTFESLKRDDELERFYGAIPDFCATPGDPLGGFIRPNKDKLSRALAGMMDRTFSSVLVPESIKQRLHLRVGTPQSSSINIQENSDMPYEVVAH